MSRNKPKSPAQIAKERAEAREREARERAAERDRSKRPDTWGADAKALARRPDVVVIPEKGRRTRVQTAYRSNVFRLLAERGSITAPQKTAAESLMELYARAWGLDGKQGSSERVDGPQGHADLVTDRMLQASAELASLLVHLGPVSRAIMDAFAVAIIREDRPMAWRGIVQRVTACTNEGHQVGVVVVACEEVRRVTFAEGRIAA